PACSARALPWPFGLGGCLTRRLRSDHGGFRRGNEIADDAIRPAPSCSFGFFDWPGVTPFDGVGDVPCVGVPVGSGLAVLSFPSVSRTTAATIISTSATPPAMSNGSFAPNGPPPPELLDLLPLPLSRLPTKEL